MKNEEMDFDFVYIYVDIFMCVYVRCIFCFFVCFILACIGVSGFWFCFCSFIFDLFFDLNFTYY